MRFFKKLLNLKLFIPILIILSFLVFPIKAILAIDAPIQSLDVNGVNIFNIGGGYNSSHGIAGISFDVPTHTLTMNNAAVNNISASGDLDILIIGDNSVIPSTESTAIIAMGGDLTITGDNATLDITAFSASQIAITIGAGGRLTIGEAGKAVEVTVTQGLLNNCEDTYVVDGNTFNTPDSGEPVGPPAGDPLQILIGGDLVIDETAEPQITSATGTGWSIEDSVYGGYQINIDSEVSPTFEYISGIGDGSISINANGGDVTITENLGYSVFFDGNVEIRFAMGTEEQVGDVHMMGGIFTHGRVNSGDGDVYIGTEDAKATDGIGAESVVLSFGSFYINTSGIGLYYYDLTAPEDEGMYLESAQTAEMVVASSDVATTKVSIATVLGGGSIDLSYATELGDFIPLAGYWSWAEFTGTAEENLDPTIVECVEGTDPDNKYSLTLSSGNFLLESTAKALYQLGYNYEEGGDSTVVNGTVNVIAANGYKFVSGGFYDFSIEEGTEVTIELLPDYGYQYVSGGINGMPTSPETGKASYTFTMPSNHVHISAIFEAMSDIVDIETAKIKTANLAMPEEQINGNAELLIEDAENVEQTPFQTAASGFTMGTYLNLSLNEVIFKGTTDEAWRTSITELEEDSVVTLALSDELKGHAEYKVIREHEGVVEVIETTYDPSAGTLRFNTDAYSVYGIAYNDPVNPNTYDGILTALSVTLVGTTIFGAVKIYLKKRM